MEWARLDHLDSLDNQVEEHQVEEVLHPVEGHQMEEEFHPGEEDHLLQEE